MSLDPENLNKLPSNYNSIVDEDNQVEFNRDDLIKINKNVDDIYISEDKDRNLKNN